MIRGQPAGISTTARTALGLVSAALAVACANPSPPRAAATPPPAAAVPATSPGEGPRLVVEPPAFDFGTVVAGVRGMSATESAETLIMYQLTFLTAAYALALPFGFIMPGELDALIMIGSGVGNGAAQYLWTRAIHLALQFRDITQIIECEGIGGVV